MPRRSNFGEAKVTKSRVQNQAFIIFLPHNEAENVSLHTFFIKKEGKIAFP